MLDYRKLESAMEDLRIILESSSVSSDGSFCWSSDSKNVVPKEAIKYLTLAVYEAAGVVSEKSRMLIDALESADVEYSFGPGGVKFDGFI